MHSAGDETTSPVDRWSSALLLRRRDCHGNHGAEQVIEHDSNAITS